MMVIFSGSLLFLFLDLKFKKQQLLFKIHILYNKNMKIHNFIKFFKHFFNLFQFGHGLQQLLTTVPYSEISGQKNIEWDAVQVCAKFMRQWLTVPSVIKSLSGHWQTQEKIPDDLLKNALEGM